MGEYQISNYSSLLLKSPQANSYMKRQHPSEYRDGTMFSNSEHVDNALHFKISKLEKEIFLYQQKIKNIEN